MYEDGLSQQKIGAFFDRCHRTIGNVLKRNGVASRSPHNIVEESKIRNAVKDGSGLTRVCSESGYCPKTVKKYLGERTLRRQRRYDLDRGYFLSIDSPEKAYWLGFLLADGSVNKRLGRFAISLQARDSDHLSSLKEALSYSGPVNMKQVRPKNGKTYWKTEMTVCSREMKNNLESLGFALFKRGDTSILNIIRQDLIRYVVRGLFDGDGGLHLSSRRVAVSFVDAHRSVVEWMMDHFVKTLGINRKKIYSRRGKAWSFQYDRRTSCEEILDYIYGGGGPSLKRKYEKFLCLKSRNW
jgi:hypothetical protein